MAVDQIITVDGKLALNSDGTVALFESEAEWEKLCCSLCPSGTTCPHCDDSDTPDSYTVTVSGVDAGACGCIAHAQGAVQRSIGSISISIDGIYLLSQMAADRCGWWILGAGSYSYRHYTASRDCTGAYGTISGSCQLRLTKQATRWLFRIYCGAVPYGPIYAMGQTVGAGISEEWCLCVPDITQTGACGLGPAAGRISEGGVATFEQCDQT